jgi:electron transport complex protein RnfC
MSAPTFDLGKLHGGLRLPAEKSQSTARPIIEVPLPAQLVLPLAQHVGDPAQPVVGIGEKVLKGQLLAMAEGVISAPVHAPSSGKVIAIEPWPVSRRRGDKAPCIIIQCDGEDRAIDRPEAIADYRSLAHDDLQQQILRGGIVGLGGAVFPTAQKLMQAVSGPLEHLILNGVECEPYISCDDMLMREQAMDILQGAQVLLHALSVESCLVVVESDKPEALASMVSALNELNDPRLVLKQVPTIYPSGGEDQLVQLVANREVPSGGLPSDVGCVVQNVGTAAAVHRWINHGEPLISRITTVTGDGIAEPCNVRARIGTTLDLVVQVAGGYTERAATMVIGGPMCGKSVSTDEVPLVKATNCVLVMSAVAAAGEEKPCIRCGDCAAVCPVQLLPQQLYWHACSDNEAKLRDFGLTDCIECGCCDLVCPSHIPLTADFRKAKARMRELADEKARAERARQRFESRNERIRKERLLRDDELAAQKQAALKAGPDAIADIMSRAKKATKTTDEEQ